MLRIKTPPPQTNNGESDARESVRLIYFFPRQIENQSCRSKFPISGGQSRQFWAILTSILTTILMSILELFPIRIVRESPRIDVYSDHHLPAAILWMIPWTILGRKTTSHLGFDLFYVVAMLNLPSLLQRRAHQQRRRRANALLKYRIRDHKG